MLAMSDERTLAEDWFVRRQRLMMSQTVSEQHRRMQLQVLDYLIRRYGDSAEAARPARFASTAEFYSNDRAIVVHQHLGRGKIAGVKSQVEASRRVGDIVKHLRSVHDGDSGAAPAHNDFSNWIDELGRRPRVPEGAWCSMWRTLRYGGHVHRMIAEALKESPYLPRAALAYLCRCLSNTKQVDVRAAELLIQCQTETAPNYAARAWRKRVESRCDDAVTRILRAFLVARRMVPDAIREQLAAASVESRLAAVDVLREAGTLDDVALLSDLASLPRSVDEDPRERNELLDVMWAIARRE
jgi:hypothetical protein